MHLFVTSLPPPDSFRKEGRRHLATLPHCCTDQYVLVGPVRGLLICTSIVHQVAFRTSCRTLALRSSRQSPPATIRS